MKKKVFTQRDFLKACDLINQANDLSFEIWFDSDDSDSFNKIFTNKKKAKEILYEKIGVQIAGFNVFDINHPYGF